MDIALDYYRIFEAVARHRSFTRAAEALVNSQPNLTRAVHNLEAELGCRLFLRSSRGVELTPEGEALYAHVTAAMEQLRAGEAELQRQRELRSGMVSIACSETALHAVLLPVPPPWAELCAGYRGGDLHAAPAACEKRPRHRLCAGCSAPRPRHRAPAPARGPAGAGRLPHPPHGPAPQRRCRRTRNDASFAAEQVK